MIISALDNYYRILISNPEIEIPLYGFSSVKVSFEFVLNQEARLIQIIPLEQTYQLGKKEYNAPKKMIVPQQVKKTVNIAANFLCDNANYVLGLTRSEDQKEKDKTLLRFEEFKSLHHKILYEKNSELGNVLLNYLNNYKYSDYLELIKPYEEALKKGGSIVFCVNGKYLHEDEYIKKIWINYISQNSNDVKMQCLASGKNEYIARLHPSIKGVKDAQPSGASLVSFNARAYESYTKENMQGLNAPVSEEVTFNYTTALNYLLSSKKQKIQIGDATTVFWAESSNDKYTNYVNLLLDLPSMDKQNNSVEDTDYEQSIFHFLNSIKEGYKIDYDALKIDPTTKFYILGLSPNMSRLSIRYWYANSFDAFLHNLLQHYIDMRIEKKYQSEYDSIPIWRVIQETTNPKTKEKPNPLLSSSLMRAIITGESYPRILLSLIINRIRCDRDSEKDDNVQINYTRVSIIKAYLTRYARKSHNKKLEEVLTLSLNEQTQDTAYLLGRLFAVLEKVQKDALGRDINSTIKDRYFSSACATPSSAFPTLLKLAQAHIAKADYGYVSDMRISEIMSKFKVTSFPAHLSLEEQGIFIIGYYHQTNAFYKKSENEKQQ